MSFLTLFLVSCARLHMGKLNFYYLLCMVTQEQRSERCRKLIHGTGPFKNLSKPLLVDSRTCTYKTVISFFIIMY